MQHRKFRIKSFKLLADSQESSLGDDLFLRKSEVVTYL